MWEENPNGEILRNQVGTEKPTSPDCKAPIWNSPQRGPQGFQKGSTEVKRSERNH